jgi:hypothetical protein
MVAELGRFGQRTADERVARSGQSVVMSRSQCTADGEKRKRPPYPPPVGCAVGVHTSARYARTGEPVRSRRAVRTVIPRTGTDLGRGPGLSADQARGMGGIAIGNADWTDYS